MTDNPDPFERLKADWEARQNVWWNRPFKWAMDAAEANEKSFVEDHRRARRLHKHALIKILAFAGLTVFSSFFVIYPLALLWCAGIWGATGAIAAFSTLHRARAYRTGYLDGRNKMMQALHRADERGVPIQAFIHQEMIKDIEGVVW